MLSMTQNKQLNQILIGAVLLLIIVNIGLIVFLAILRSQVAHIAGQAAQIVQQLQTQTPIMVNATIDDTLTLPIKTSVPVRTTVRVPVVIPITGQSVTVSVPIDTTVPIETTIKVPVKMTVPVSIKVSDFSVGPLLQQVQNWLTRLASPW